MDFNRSGTFMNSIREKVDTLGGDSMLSLRLDDALPTVSSTQS